MEHLEVMPVSTRVVCLNAPHLKSLCVFEALSRTLGCYYNHHRSQMGTYLVFYLTHWTHIRECNLVLNGIEKVPRTNVPPRIILERIHSPDSTESPPSHKDETQTNGDTREGFSLTRVNTLPLPDHSNIAEANNPTSLPASPKNYVRRDPSRSINQESQGCLQVNNKIETAQKQKRENIQKNEPERQMAQKEVEKTHNHITLNMDETEEITTLLDEDEDEYTSDTSDDLHKVVRKRLSVDITPLLNPHPKDKLLVLLLRPAEETQAWQFLSSCLKITHSSSRTMVVDGSGTIKKALTRTKPLYFSKNGNVHRI
ncbi:hypothetical protein Hamer_G007504 [Homarus americanus]|uniref:Uncharacterized protein n=1 Tax=Homarus americanus TaxID=6706 RepID=A0A8J5JYR7_HOMAM|nr:hypothetical protein Hamer_G007504 [Homarus americanus]